MNNLKKLSDGNSVKLMFVENFNIFTYLKNKDFWNIEQALSYLLYSFGYLTKSDIKGAFKVRNNEVKKGFKKYVGQAWVSNILEVSNQKAWKFSEDLSINLRNHLEFSKILQSQLLSKFSPEEKSEAFFEYLIGSIIEIYYFWNKNTALYYTIGKKTVNHERIDNIFLPNQESVNKSETIIHEYKILNKTIMNINVETACNDALWEIYLKNYLAEPLAEYKILQIQENWRVKIRPIVIYKNQNDSKWSVSVDSYEFNYLQAKKIHSLFDNISINQKQIMCNYDQVEKMRKARKELLNKYLVDSLENLIAKQIKYYSENNFMESKEESEIDCICDFQKEKSDKDSKDDKTELLSMSESVIEKIVEGAPKKSHDLLSKFLKNKGYNIKQKDIEKEFKGKCVGIGPKTAETLFEKIKTFKTKRKHSEAFPDSNIENSK